MYIAEIFDGSIKNEPGKVHDVGGAPEVVNEANSSQLVVLYPGRFQPFHLGHADVFRTLQAKFGRDNVYIATSNKADGGKSPFNFTDKVTIMHAAGVPSDRILEVQSPYKLPAQFDATTTVLVVTVGAPDAARLQVDGVKKDGNPGYYKTFKSLEECVTADKHGYVVIASERQKVITLNGQQVDVSHGTPSRAAWNSVRKDPKGRAEYMNQMFGRADQELGLVLDKIPESVQTTESITMKRKEITQPIHPEEMDRLVTSVGQKAKQGPMKTVWNPLTRKYKVVPEHEAALEEDDMAPMSREEYNARRKALQQIQMDPQLTRDPTLRKELIKKIAQLTMQARSAGVLPESAHAAHVQENKMYAARSIVETIKYLKESLK
jgi:predicted SPOUT superfamily RNA methylase MTH1